MQIILISDRLARARSVSLSLRHLIGSALLALAMVLGATAALYWLTLRYAAEVPLPALQRLVLSAHEAETERSRAFVQQNLNAMAVKVGEMQAQLTRLDALGERLSSLAGIRDFRFSEAPGLGGAAPTLMPPQNLSLTDFSEKLTLLSRQVESRNDMLGVLEEKCKGNLSDGEQKLIREVILEGRLLHVAEVARVPPDHALAGAVPGVAAGAEGRCGSGKDPVPGRVLGDGCLGCVHRSPPCLTRSPPSHNLVSIQILRKVWSGEDLRRSG